MFNLILCKITKEVLFATALILKKNKMETFKAVIGTGLTWDGNNETEEEKNIVDKLISKEYTLLTVFTKNANYKVNVSDFFSIARKVIPEDKIINNNDGNVILILATTKMLRWQKRKLLRLYRKYIK